MFVVFLTQRQANGDMTPLQRYLEGVCWTIQLIGPQGEKWEEIWGGGRGGI